MKHFRFALALRVIVALFAVSLIARPAKAITFGEPDSENRFPNVGAIVVPEGLPGAPYIAGSGVLIHPRVLLTAGHVTIGGEELLRQGVPLFDFVRFSFGTDAFDPTTWVRGVALMTHPGFASAHEPYEWHPDFPDIGVIILEEAVDLPVATLAYEGLLNDLKDAGLLVDQANPPRFLAVGYGATLEFPPAIETPGDGLRRISFPEYRALTQTQLHLNQNSAAGNSGIARGDSGGPLFWLAPDGELIVVAIHSHTDPERTAM